MLVGAKRAERMCSLGLVWLFIFWKGRGDFLFFYLKALVSVCLFMSVLAFVCVWTCVSHEGPCQAN